MSTESLAEIFCDTHKAWTPVFVPSRFVTKPAYEEVARQAAFRQLDIQYARLDRIMQEKNWRLFGTPQRQEAKAVRDFPILSVLAAAMREVIRV